MSVNVYKRKRRAYIAVIPLSCLSIGFHLTKGLDYEEAAFSCVLLIALVLGHREFTVKSGIPDFHDVAVKLALGFGMTLTYGVLGFWLLDRHQFHVDFTWYQAIQSTVSLVLLAPGPLLMPHTAYAKWFLESFYLITATAITYAVATLFRAIFYFFRGETTVDLMRHRRGAPNGTMDYLFVKLLLRSKEEGFKRFNMGMAPMSGFRETEQASAEERAVHYFFQRMTFIFSYAGPTHCKAKFASVWEPRYIIYRHVLDQPRVALALARCPEGVRNLPKQLEPGRSCSR